MIRGTHTKFVQPLRKAGQLPDQRARDFIAALLQQYPVAVVLKAVPPIRFEK